MSTFLAVLPALLVLFVALWAHWRASVAFKAVWEALQPLLTEAERIETRRFELESELDVRIKRLLARESYWRGEAARRSEPDVADVGSTGEARAAEPQPPFSATGSESTLDLRRRLRGA